MQEVAGRSTLASMRGVVFDFDGVIVDSEPLHEAALRDAARALGMDFTHERYVGEYIGYDDRDVLLAVSRDSGRKVTEAEAGRFHEVKREAFLRVIAEGRVAPFGGSVELIRACAARGPIAVCSGARRHEIAPILEHLGVMGLMAAVVSADAVPRSKPDPAPYLLTAKLLGLPPRELAAIEDTPTGIASAIEAGYRVAGVAHSVDGGLLTRATRVFGSTAELSPEALHAMWEMGADACSR